MGFLFVLLLMCLYIFIGGLLAGLFDDDEVMIFLWPIALPITVLMRISDFAYDIGENLRDLFTNFKTTIRRRKRK